jgi:hypothetical protein
MKEELTARLEAKIEVELKTNNAKLEVIQSTCFLDGYLPSQDSGHSRRNNTQDGHYQEGMGASVNAG